MQPSRRDALKLTGLAMVGFAFGRASAESVFETPTPARIPLDEFVKDQQLMDALRRGVRAMKARKPSDPLSWFYQAAIHGVPARMIQAATNGTPAVPEFEIPAVPGDPAVTTVDQEKYWNQCPHFGKASANFLPWHRGYTYYFERILRAHTNEPRFALPYWDYSKPENYRFPKEFGIPLLNQPLDNDRSNPLYHTDRNAYFAEWTHWSGTNLPYSQLTPEAVDWAPARDAETFFGATEREGLGGAVGDEDRGTRGRLESFPHDPIHRLTGIITPDQFVPDPDNPGQMKFQAGDSFGMSGPPTAGFDPIFCVHHSNIDRLWAMWALMSGKSWGTNFPSKQWFNEPAWTFFDIKMEDGKLVPIEVSRPRRDYFDSRKLGITFKDEDLTQQPLTLPDPLPDPPTKNTTLELIASVPAAVRVTGARPDRISILAVAAALKEPFERAKAAADVDAAATRRMFMRLNDVDLGGTNATGYDVHLVAAQGGIPKRTDPSFVGSITLFRHHNHTTAEHGHVAAPSKKPVELFDITKALRSAAQPDPTKMHVVVVPFSLSQGTAKNVKIVELNTLTFSSVDFLGIESE